MRFARLIQMLALLAALGASRARADIIVLVNGEKITGQIVEEDRERVVVRVAYGQYAIPRERIRSIERQSPLEGHLAQGDELCARGRFRMGLREYQRALRLEPDSKKAQERLASGYARFGRYCLARKRFKEARAYFEKLKAIDPKSLDAAAGFAQLDEAVAKLRVRVRAGRLALTAGRLTEAIEKLEAVLADAPDLREEINPLLGQAYAVGAAVRYKEKRWGECAALIDRALASDPALAGELEAPFIASHLQLLIGEIGGDKLAAADARAKRLLDFAPTNGLVLYYAGALAEKAGRPAEAVARYARALGRTPPRVATAELARELREALWKKLGGGEDGQVRIVVAEENKEEIEKAEPGDWLRLEGERFAVLHHNLYIAKRVLDTAERAYEKIVAELTGEVKDAWPGRCEIRVYRNQKEYLAGTGQESWSGGVSHFETRGGRLKRQYIATYQTSPKLFKSVVPHELTHLVMNGWLRYSRAFPIALHEGIAVNMEPSFRVRYYAKIARTKVSGGGHVPLDELLAMKGYPTDPELFYAQSASLVAFLLAHGKGGPTFLAFAKDVEKLGVERSLAKHYGYGNLKALEEAWVEFVLKGKVL